MAKGGLNIPSLGGPIATAIAVAVTLAHFAELRAYYRHLEKLPEISWRQLSALQTENAFYYSYYQELIVAPSLKVGMEEIVWDKRSEYPDVLNAARRFNIFQEVSLALVYRGMAACGLAFVDPWDLFRNTVLFINALGNGALAMLAAEVSGNPFAGICGFVLAFLNRFQISRLGNYSSLNLRESWGIPVLWMQVLCLWRLIKNSQHKGDCVGLWRWFGFLTFVFLMFWQFAPFLLLLQVTALYFVYLVCGYRSRRHVVVGAIDTYLLTLALATACMFASPYLLTSPFLLVVSALKVTTLLFSRRCASTDAASGAKGAVGIWLWRRLVDVFEGLVALALFALARKAIAPFATADEHVYELLCTKFPAMNDWLPKQIRLNPSQLPDCTEPSFNAQLYLIMGVFKMIEEATLKVYWDSTATQSCSLAVALIIARFVFGSLPKTSALAAMGPEREAQADLAAAELLEGPVEAKGGAKKRKGSEAKEKTAGGKEVPSKEKEKPVARGKAFRIPTSAESTLANEEVREEAALLFFVGQFLLFLLLGALINRLRVAFGPLMIVLGASCLGPRVFPLRWLLRKQPVAIMGALALAHCLQLSSITSMLPCPAGDVDGVCTHFSDKMTTDGDLVDLFDWMNHHLPPRSPVLASMNLAGSMRLFSSASLIIHPQFESANLRKRVQLAYEFYHCGSEEAFAETMVKLNAEYVIFEYYRCFFTPYLLDDKRKNCDSRKHKSEDQLCVKLHTSLHNFRLVFANGGYAMFQFQGGAPKSADVSAKAMSTVGTLLNMQSTWDPFLETCQSWGDDCGTRLAEMAATWHHSLKRPREAKLLRGMATRLYPDNPVVSFYVGRALDFDENRPQEAGLHYETAARRMPNNPTALKEYLMWLDIVGQDQNKIRKLLNSRNSPRKGKLQFMDLQGTDAAGFLCEAGTSAVQLGLTKMGRDMWDEALRRAPFSKCSKHNWPLIHPDSTWEAEHSTWKKFELWRGSSTEHDIGPHNSPPVRFHAEAKFRLFPQNYTG